MLCVWNRVSFSTKKSGLILDNALIKFLGNDQKIEFAKYFDYIQAL